MIHLFEPYSFQYTELIPESNFDYYTHCQINRYIHRLDEGIAKSNIEASTNITRVNQEALQNMSYSLRENLCEGFGSIRQEQIEIHSALFNQTTDINQGFDYLNSNLDRQFSGLGLDISEVGNRIEQVGETIVAVGHQLSDGIASLNSSFDMGMTKVITLFDLQRTELKIGFNRVIEVLENSNKVTAKEIFLDGKVAYENYQQYPRETQFFIDAMEYLKNSIALFRGNPYAHFYLGHTYQEPSKHYDLNKSLEHYKQCAIYGKGTADFRIAALGYFNASWIAYVLNQIDEAIELAELSRDFDNSIPENWYNLGKISCM